MPVDGQEESSLDSTRPNKKRRAEGVADTPERVPRDMPVSTTEDRQNAPHSSAIRDSVGCAPPRTIVVLDLETTGLGEKRQIRPTQLSAAVFEERMSDDGSCVVGIQPIPGHTQFNVYVALPRGTYFAPGAQRVTGITPETLEQLGRPWAEVQAEFTRWIAAVSASRGELCIATYNGENFDIPVLLSMFKEAGAQNAWPAVFEAATFVDILKAVRAADRCGVTSMAHYTKCGAIDYSVTPSPFTLEKASAALYDAAVGVHASREAGGPVGAAHMPGVGDACYPHSWSAPATPESMIITTAPQAASFGPHNALFDVGMTAAMMHNMCVMPGGHAFMRAVERIPGFIRNVIEFEWWCTGPAQLCGVCASAGERVHISCQVSKSIANPGRPYRACYGPCAGEARSGRRMGWLDGVDHRARSRTLVAQRFLVNDGGGRHEWDPTLSPATCARDPSHYAIAEFGGVCWVCDGGHEASTTLLGVGSSAR